MKTLEELKKMFRFQPEGTGFRAYGNKKDIKKYTPDIMAHKEEIKAEIRAAQEAKEAEQAAYQAKLDGIEGLIELKAAINAEENYSYAFKRSMESEYPVQLPAKPAVGSNELRAKYPRAAAYLLADSWAYASNVDKYSAGKAAREAILNGEDHEQALADMEAKWTAASQKAMWN